MNVSLDEQPVLIQNFMIHGILSDQIFYRISRGTAF